MAHIGFVLCVCVSGLMTDPRRDVFVFFFLFYSAVRVHFDMPLELNFKPKSGDDLPKRAVQSHRILCSVVLLRQWQLAGAAGDDPEPFRPEMSIDVILDAM